MLSAGVVNRHKPQLCDSADRQIHKDLYVLCIVLIEPQMICNQTMVWLCWNKDRVRLM